MFPYSFLPALQTVTDKEHYWPENKITSLMFNDSKKCIVSGAVKLKERHRIKKSNLQASNPIVFSLFNANFGQVVTGDGNCTVNVYNVETGEKVFAFDEVHGNSTLSAWCFDNSGRRLLTGGQDGSLKMWNFNNGQCLKVFNGFGDDEITCVAYVQEGSNKYVDLAPLSTPLVITISLSLSVTIASALETPNIRRKPTSHQMNE